ncbi:hypothetical protein EW145_g748 [Phellinidium pouzarii]|uniref:Uncharacterized protein n=1 Tax=Phellinidium pouzarii TaxID=167371 RepID=A0A4S4LH34_9AGAM|nr:hypothetical protein EW145_g748 [Phellinidium pouzarii]
MDNYSEGANGGTCPSALSVVQDDDDDGDGQLTPLYHPHAHASETSGSFFLSHQTKLQQLDSRKSTRPSTLGLKSDNIYILQTPPDSPASPLRQLSTVTNAFTPMPASPSNTSLHLCSHTAESTQLTASFCVASTSLFSGCFSPDSSQSANTASDIRSDPEDKWSPTLTSTSETQSTPPLTPDLYNEIRSPLDAYRQGPMRSRRSASITIRNEDTSASAEVKKGKDPALPFSRESWAAIHRGTIPPNYEDVNFQEWQRWHHNLERLELRRRRKRTIDFIEESERLSNLYLDEAYARRAILIHSDILTDDEIYDAHMWVEYTVERRPDPYHPPEKHNIGWIIKNHRSLACLNELKEMPIDN